jgi:hypothetical protein
MAFSQTGVRPVKPIIGYLGLLFLCMLIIAFVPVISIALPHAGLLSKSSLLRLFSR